MSLCIGAYCVTGNNNSGGLTEKDIKGQFKLS